MPLPRLPSSAEFLATTPAAISPPEISADDALALVRVIATVRGWRGNAGGWILDSAGRPIVQGWAGLCAIATARKWLVHVPTTTTWINGRRKVVGWKIDWRAVGKFWPGCVQQAR